jgi:hypothetical protein
MDPLLLLLAMGKSRLVVVSMARCTAASANSPAVYVAALLIEDGYADASRRGYIRFRRRWRKPAKSTKRSAAS